MRGTASASMEKGSELGVAMPETAVMMMTAQRQERRRRAEVTTREQPPIELVVPLLKRLSGVGG